MKRMIEVSIEDNHTTVCINSSSLEIINSCMKKAQYALSQGYVKDEESLALRFGSEIHRSLEQYYRMPVIMREETAKKCVEEFSFENGDDKRNTENGQKILANYFNIYSKDPWKMHSSPPFQSLAEVPFEFELFTSKELTINWHGVIDAIMVNDYTGEFAVFDHKTSSTLGKEFIQRWNPNHQIVGYVLGAQKVFGLDVNKAVINGIQVAKTKLDLMRVEVDIDEHHIIQFKEAVLWAVRKYLVASSLDVWPMVGGSTCSQWGGCQFLDVCSVGPKSRDLVLKEKYGVKTNETFRIKTKSEQESVSLRG